jgi:phospholipid-transporting ATPase
MDKDDYNSNPFMTYSFEDGNYEEDNDTYEINNYDDDVGLTTGQTNFQQKNLANKYAQRSFMDKIKDSSAYTSVAHVFNLMRGKDDTPPPSDSFRYIQLNDPMTNSLAKYAHNRISTAKYNVFTFLYKFLKEQFSKYANVFFLVTAIIQQIPGVSPLNPLTTILPLSFVLLVSAVKEIFEDYKRHMTDNTENNRKIQVLVGNSFVEKKWRDLHVGDIVRVENSSFFPADLILLSSSEPDALCYIETSNLDGETNLKVRQGLPETSHLTNAEAVSEIRGVLKSEQPNNSLYTYEGVIELNGKELPLTPNQLLLRGSQLRNTKWVYAIIINTGHETKLMKNATEAPIKQTNLEKMTNVQIVFLFVILVSMSLLCSFGYFFKDFGDFQEYVFQEKLLQKFSDIIYGFFTFIILFNNLIPISLVVTMEFVKYGQSILINSDIELYHEETDTPTQCKTSNLVEELGQVEYIFSDKTGTLTCNVMEFKMCTIAGKSYAKEVTDDKRIVKGENGVEKGYYDFNRLIENSKEDISVNVIVEFLTLLAVCHTVIPEQSDTVPEGYIYQASSPDEGALVKGAATLGYVFTTRRPKSVTILVDGVEKEFELLNICEFNSTRKRMSVIVRTPEGQIKLYTKGADTVILERLSGNNPYVDYTLNQLEEYATEGLRTLCLATRDIPEDEYVRWNKEYEKAATSLTNRAAELDRVAEMIEKDLFLLGATAIEDKLQDGVPDTIHTLAQANIKLWVLTGDKQETAINIGYSCKLLTEEMSLIICNEETHNTTKEFISNRLRSLKESMPAYVSQRNFQHQTPVLRIKSLIFGRKDDSVDLDEIEPLALVIDGKSLGYALEPDMELMFLELATLCRAVICCRVSPLQKALIVKLVKKYTNSILLAIGDGANDVGMIQAAHVGVGISGVEGLQAARSSDFAIAQFRYLRKLILVHGTWSYQRLSKLILYSFYKNIAMFMTQFWFTLDNGFSGQTLYESWTITSYNVIFTVFSPMVIGLFDQFLNARMLDQYPQLYKIGQKSEIFNIKIFWGWILNGFFHSFAIYHMTKWIWFESIVTPGGQSADLWMMGIVMFTIVLAVVLLKAILITNNWNKFTTYATVGAFVVWIIGLPIYGWIAPGLFGISPELIGVSMPLYTSLMYWISLLVIPVFCLLRDYLWKYYKRFYKTESYHIVQEMQKFNIPDYRPRMEWFRKAVHKVRMTQRLKRNRGYAFSQNEGGQARVIRAYDTTQNKPSG